MPTSQNGASGTDASRFTQFTPLVFRFQLSLFVQAEEGGTNLSYIFQELRQRGGSDKVGELS